MFAPVQDRDVKDEGFTHKVGGVVTISNDKLGRLINTVRYCTDYDPWTFGFSAFMRNLAMRGFI